MVIETVAFPCSYRHSLEQSTRKKSWRMVGRTSEIGGINKRPSSRPCFLLSWSQHRSFGQNMVRIPKNGIEKKQQPSFFKIIFPRYSTEHLSVSAFSREYLSTDQYREIVGRNLESKCRSLYWNTLLCAGWTAFSHAKEL